MLKKYCPLRERKYAKRKQAILNAFLEKIRNEQIEEISVKEICEEVNISEGTFFNYFPKKTDVLVYFIAVWSLEVLWCAYKKEKESGSSLKAIEEIYYHTAELMQANVPVMYEIIAQIAHSREMIAINDLSVAEKLIAYPELKGIEKIEAKNLNDIFKPFLKKAIASKELPDTIDIASILLTLRSIFFGTATALTQEHVNKVKNAYRYHLQILWKSIQ